MNENVVKFFELYDSDPELRAKVQAAEDAYPGSIEIREYVVEDVLIPIAEEMGLGFTLTDLKKYETKLKFKRSTEPTPEEGDEVKIPVYWLLDRGWQNDEAVFCGDKKEEKKNLFSIEELKKREEADKKKIEE